MENKLFFAVTDGSFRVAAQSRPAPGIAEQPQLGGIK